MPALPPAPPHPNTPSHTQPPPPPTSNPFFPGRTAPTSFQSSSTRTLLPGVLPVLPFPPSEALTPGAALTLHLFEARYLALLDAALARPDRCFVHAVIGAGPAAWASGARDEGGAAGEEMGGTVSEWAAGGGGEVVGTAPAPPRPAGGPRPCPWATAGPPCGARSWPASPPSRPRPEAAPAPWSPSGARPAWR